MKDERKKTIFIYFIAIAFCIVFSTNIYSSIKSYRYRKLCNQYREQLITATDENRELTNRFGRITEVVGRIKETTNANIADARGIVEGVEILRTQIQELEDCCYGYDTLDSYYSYWDNEFGIE